MFPKWTDDDDDDDDSLLTRKLSVYRTTVTTPLLYFYNVSSYSAIQPQECNKLSVSVYWLISSMIPFPSHKLHRQWYGALVDAWKHNHSLAFFVCSYTQKCSSKYICAVLLLPLGWAEPNAEAMGWSNAKAHSESSKYKILVSIYTSTYADVVQYFSVRTVLQCRHVARHLMGSPSSTPTVCKSLNAYFTTAGHFSSTAILDWTPFFSFLYNRYLYNFIPLLPSLVLLFTKTGSRNWCIEYET